MRRDGDASSPLASVLAAVFALACVVSVPAQDSLAGNPGDLGSLDGMAAVRATRPASDELDDAAPVDPFAAACAAYRASDFDRASRLFARLAEHEDDEPRRAVLHANAGTAAARAGRPGEAVWHLEAALRGDPRDVVARRNLAMVRAQLPEARTGEFDDPSDFTGSLLRLPLVLTGRETETLLAALGGFALLLLAGVRARRFPRGAATTALVLLLLDGGLYLASDAARAADLRRAVVIEQVALRGEPDARGRVVVVLGPGTVVRDEESRAGWRLVETPGGGRGWAPSDSVRAAAR